MTPADTMRAAVEALTEDQIERWRSAYQAGTIGSFHALCHLIWNTASIPPITPVEAGKAGVAAGVPVRCKDCDLPNGCPEYCWCDAAGAGKAEYASWFPILARGVLGTQGDKA